MAVAVPPSEAHAPQADTLQPDTLEAPPADTLAPPGYRLEDLRVTVTRSSRYWARVPYALSLVPGERIQRAERGLSLDQALRGVPGVTVQNRQNFSLGDRVMIR
ncbi:MAG: Plug domain-containing protein, partial [Gemmatimonadota bacterium]